MHSAIRAIAPLALSLFLATPAAAQRFRFERTFDVPGHETLDVATVRGKIEVLAGAPGRVVVSGVVTVRVGWNVPANAVELAKRVAAQPPVRRDGTTTRLRTPDADDERRAVIVSYVVQVPPDTDVVTLSDSGATSVSGVEGRVKVRTQSAAIVLARLGGQVEATTGSGAIGVDGVGGTATITTQSSGITARGLNGGLHVRTQSGAVDVSLTGTGDVDVETGSSAIKVRGATGAVTATTQSGRVDITGLPKRQWHVTNGSGAIDVAFAKDAALTLDAESGSGSVESEGEPVVGSVSKGRIEGTIRGGGARVRLYSRSGSISVRASG
jgi:DUF4097 and DUF4098 domain-containing protein YvlB